MICAVFDGRWILLQPWKDRSLCQLFLPQVCETALEQRTGHLVSWLGRLRRKSAFRTNGARPELYRIGALKRVEAVAPGIEICMSAVDPREGD